MWKTLQIDEKTGELQKLNSGKVIHFEKYKHCTLIHIINALVFSDPMATDSHKVQLIMDLCPIDIWFMEFTCTVIQFSLDQLVKMADVMGSELDSIPSPSNSFFDEWKYYQVYLSFVSTFKAFATGNNTQSSFQELQKWL
ncbi:hypothetical protein K439DRAFT_1616004 [Ramaria rubella]|nr:hypothetical protein K439DRAFT_1616004 [Ramaria rubella]